MLESAKLHSSAFHFRLLLPCMRNPHLFTFCPSLAFFWIKNYTLLLLVCFYETFGIFWGLPQR